ncbi:MAG: adenylate/guanylate cyclase domain-containing protein [Bacteroidota bacterium]
MKHLLRHILLLPFCLLFCFPSFGQDSLMDEGPKPLYLQAGYSYWDLDSVLLVYLDSSHQGFEDIYALKGEFSDVDILHDSLDNDLHLWTYLPIINQKKDSFTLTWATGGYPFMEMYILRDNGRIDTIYNGVSERVSRRTRRLGKGDLFDINMAEGELVEVLLHRYNDGTQVYYPYINAEIWGKEAHTYFFYSNKFDEYVLLSGFLCVLLIIIIYNLIIYASTREIAYLYYALYLLTIGLAISLENLTREFPWLGFDDPNLNKSMALIMILLTPALYFLFGRAFINSKELTPKWDIGMRIFIGVRLVASVIFLIIALTRVTGYIQYLQLSFLLSLIFMGLELLFIFIYFVPLIRSKNPVVWFFIAGTISLFVVGFLSIFLQNLLDEFDGFIYFLVSILVEILIFSFGLGYKFRKTMQEKLDAEHALNQELSKVNSAFGRFVPHEFIQSLGYDTVLEVQLGDQVEKEVTVFFSDIRGYTTLSEGMTPKDNFRFLNAYLGRVGPIIQEKGGFVNQYYGDGIMALFTQKSADAIQAAIDIQLALDFYNEERISKNRKPIKIGMGLHTGPLMMGIIGDQLRMDATVVADTVNTASRMEGLTKFFGARLIVSQSVYDGLAHPEHFDFRYLGKVLVKGRKQPLGIYECLNACEKDAFDLKKSNLELFAKGLDAYAKEDFPTAIRAFESVMEQNPEDMGALYYMEKSKTYLLEGVSDGWNGVETMFQK